MSTIAEQFQKAFEKLKHDTETTGVANKSDCERFEIWHELLKTKLEIEREKQAKDVGRSE